MTKSLWDIESIAEIETPEVLMENQKWTIIRMQIEILKIKELQRMNEKLDKLIISMTPKSANKPAKDTGGGANG